MVLEIELNPEAVKKLEKFVNTGTYKELAESAMSFNRKLNEERKMRIPYIDGQTGVAQKHYDTQRHRRERMPGQKEGQIYSYPQKRWRKKRYQYLRYFMLPKHMRFDPDVEMHTISQVENPAAVNDDNSNSNSNISGLQGSEKTTNEWGGYYEDEFGMQEEPEEPESDSDFEYEGGRTRKTKGKKTGKTKAANAKGNSTSSRRRTHADNIPDSEKPFACERSNRSSNNRRSTNNPTMPYKDPGSSTQMSAIPPDTFEPEQIVVKQKRKIEPSGYCDFCLGDAEHNKKTFMPEELIGCAECGRSGHPSCLQFTANMNVSVKQYPWQCIECKTCTLCGTSENDDQLLFCDDCDRGYHMYCLVPPMKEAPEGSWSCQICIETFHTKKM